MKIVPVKFTAYPLETVAGKTKVPLLSGVVAQIVLVHNLLLILKDPIQICEGRIKMMALRRSLQKHTVKSSLGVSENRKRLQRESDDEDHTESQKSFHVSQDEKARIDKKPRSSKEYVGNLEEDELDEMVREDQETIRELLLATYLS